MKPENRSQCDITAWRQTEEALRQRNRELALLNRAGQTLNSTLDLDHVLATVLEEMRHLLDVVACSVWLIDPETDELVCWQAADPHGRIMRGWRLLPGEGFAGWVAHSGESLIVPDTQADERHFKDIDLQTGFALRSILSAPLRVKENVIGVLQVVDTEIDRFKPADLTLVESLAASAAIAIENARLFAAVRCQAEQLEALRQVSQDLIALRDRDALLRHIVERAIELLDGDCGGMYLYRSERQVLEWAVAVGQDLQRQEGCLLGREEGLAGKVWSTGEALIVDDYDSWPGKAPQWTGMGARAVIGIPVQWGDEFLGVLNIQSGSPEKHFTSQDAVLLSQFATQAAIAIQNVRLYEQAQQEIAERKRMEKVLSWEAGINAVIVELSRMLIQSTSLEDISLLVLEHARRLTGSVFGFVGYIDPQTGYMICPTITGNIWTPRRVEDKEIVFETFGGLWGWVLEHCKPLLTNRPEDDPRSSGTPPGHVPIHRFLSAPALVGGALVGQVALANAERDYTERDLALVERLASLYALAVQSKWTVEELRHRNEELMFFNAIATTIGQSLDLEHMLKATLDIVVEMIKVDAGWVHLLDGREEKGLLSLVACCGIPKEITEKAKTIKLGEGLTGRVAQLGQPVVELEFFNAFPFDIKAPGWKAPRAAAGLPLLAKDKVLGTLVVFGCHSHNQCFQEMHLLTAIGHQIGMAIENIRLVEEAAEIEILRELDRLRSELVANVSHELRTPLGLIEIFCTTLLREDIGFDEETRSEFLHGIKEETGKLEKIVDNLLDLSYIKDGQLQLEKHPIDVGLLAREVMKAMEVQLVRHRFVYDFPSEPLVAAVDPKRIEQVLRNLVINAIKYSPEGGRITVLGRKGDGQLLLGVSDEGIGIPLEDLERVFERFYRVENGITQQAGGVGLGLAVCKGIVEAHGGRIWVESSLGVGSIFYFVLPVNE